VAGFLLASARDLLVSHRDFSPFFVAGTQASIDHKDKLRLGKHLVGICGVVLDFMSSTHPSMVCVCECVCVWLYIQILQLVLPDLRQPLDLEKVHV